MAGFYLWLMAYRVIQKYRKNKIVPIWVALALGLGAGIATALGDALYFKIKVGAPILLVLGTNFSLDSGLRPAVVVTLVGIGVAIVAATRTYVFRPKALARSAT
jgi:sulfoxide reductase heme-binding subunit YedZ